MLRTKFSPETAVRSRSGSNLKDVRNIRNELYKTTRESGPNGPIILPLAACAGSSMNVYTNPIKYTLYYFCEVNFYPFLETSSALSMASDTSVTIKRQNFMMKGKRLLVDMGV